METGGQLHAAATLSPGKTLGPRASLNSFVGETLMPLPGFKHIIQPIPSHYSNYAILAMQWK
jgi:hypothetical protein